MLRGLPRPGGPSESRSPSSRPLGSAPAPRHTRGPALWSREQVWPPPRGLWGQTRSWWGTGRVPTCHLWGQRVPTGACGRRVKGPGLGHMMASGPGQVSTAWGRCGPEVTGPRDEELCTHPTAPSTAALLSSAARSLPAALALEAPLPGRLQSPALASGLRCSTQSSCSSPAGLRAPRC